VYGVVQTIQEQVKANPDSLRKSVRDMPDPPQIVQTFIAAFVNAWPVGDATALGTFFDEEAVYHNVPLDPVVGRDAIVATFEQFMSMGGGGLSTSSTWWPRARS
jgi:ketosteroid isomerase-like protein